MISFRWLWTLSLLLPISGGAQDAVDILAEQLVRLRGEVEALNSELAELQQARRVEMSSLTAQKGDLEATLRREELRVRQLQQALDANQAQAEEAGVADRILKPVALDAADQLREVVATTLPFKQTERLEALSELRNEIESGAVAPSRAINRLWRLYEDELRLTRDNGLYSQVIMLDGQSVLADVAKLGAVALYFRTRDGRYGLARRQGREWRFVVLESGRERNQVEALFDSLKKQIRTGYFELPNGSIVLESGS